MNSKTYSQRQPTEHACEEVVASLNYSDNLVRKEIGARIREVLKLKEWNQDRLAAEISSTRRTVQDNIAGISAPNSTSLRGYIRIGVNVNWLLAGEGPMMLADLMKGAAPLDTELLKRVVAALEAEIDRLGAELTADEFAQCVALTYEHWCGRESGGGDFVERLVRLVG